MIDLRTGELRRLYMANATRPVVVDVPNLMVLAIDGVGDPATSPTHRDAAASLVALAWRIRTTVKADAPAAVFKVMPLEGVWSLPDELTFSEDPAIRNQLRWTLQIVVPAELNLSVFESSRAKVKRRNPDLTSIDRVELRSVPEDHAAQMLHRGPYRNEPVTIDRLHRFIREHGGRPKPGHREIYLNDPRRTEPEKLRTILRVALTRP